MERARINGPYPLAGRILGQTTFRKYCENVVCPRFTLMECARNVFLIDDAGSVVWQVSSNFDSDGDPFTNIFMEGGQLKAYRWDGGSYSVDAQTGRAVPDQLLK
jgi:hypothetical protein